jgi:hypothetical protein
VTCTFPDSNKPPLVLRPAAFALFLGDRCGCGRR